MSCDLPPLNQLNLPLVYRMFIETDRLGEGIDCLERCMKTIEQPTPLHPIVGRSFMGQLDETTSWLTAFHDKCASGFEPTLMSVEMCEFDINPEEWEVNAFAFSTPLDEAFDDLGMWEALSDPLVLKGMEDLQPVIHELGDLYFDEKAPEHLVHALTVAGLLAQLHMMHLVGSAWKRAGAAGHPFGRTPLVVNVHDSDAYYVPEGTEPGC